MDSSDDPEAALAGAVGLAKRTQAIIATSGPVDLVTDGASVVPVANGSELLTRVTGGGCALGSVIAAFVAVRGRVSVLDAVAAAHTVYGVAAERAALGAAGPGSFAARFLDELSTVTPEIVAGAAR